MGAALLQIKNVLHFDLECDNVLVNVKDLLEKKKYG